MTIEIKKPFEFKGNKTWYLHKLSEKGADAIKCDFPNGDDTFTKTTLQAAIEELAANGEGSAESLIPKRVIYINPDKETVVGECYQTFAAAKAYMETYPEQKFCVELPAGDFGTTEDDHITLSEQWEIHGNKTKIVAPIDTKIVETGNMQGIYNISKSIQNCTISEGFVVDTGATGIKCYHVYDCVILKMSTDTGATPTTAAILSLNSVIKTGDESETTSTTWYLGLFMNSFVQNFNAKVGADVGFIFIGCEIAASNTHAGNVTYLCCDAGRNSVIGSTQSPEIVSCGLRYCKLIGVKPMIYNSYLTRPNIDDVTGLYLENSSVHNVLISENKTMAELTLRHSSFHYNDEESNSSTLTITTLYSDAISPISAVHDAKLVIPTRTMNIVYSTNGGGTVSNDPTGATHYGICKNLTGGTEPSNYMWFPMPE